MIIIFPLPGLKRRLTLLQFKINNGGGGNPVFFFLQSDFLWKLNGVYSILRQPVSDAQTVITKDIREHSDCIQIHTADGNVERIRSNSSLDAFQMGNSYFA